MLAGLRRAGLKLTSQRIAVVREIADDCSHPTAQELFERLQPPLPTIAALNEQHARLQFPDRDDAQERVAQRQPASPCHDARVGAWLAQLTDDVGVEQEGHSAGTSPMSRITTGSKSTSTAMRSAARTLPSPRSRS